MADLDPIVIANPCDFTWHNNLYLMWAGAYGTDRAYVWADSFDSAFEEFVEWLDNNKNCAAFYTLDESDFKEAANNLNIAWKPTWPDHQDPDFEPVWEEAESDLTVLGWSTFKCGDYLISHEWGGGDAMDDYDEVRAASQLECWGHDYEENEEVFWTDPDGLGTGWYTITDVDQDTVDIESKVASDWERVPINEISREGPPDVDVSDFDFD